MTNSPINLPEQQAELFDTVWTDFNTRFSTEALCLKEICSRLLNEGQITCHKCQNQDWKRVKDRLVRCNICGSKQSITAGTVFHHARAPKAWLATIWLMERGIFLNSVEISRRIAVAQSTAHDMIATLADIIERQNVAGANSDHTPLLSDLIWRLTRERSASTLLEMPVVASAKGRAVASVKRRVGSSAKRGAVLSANGEAASASRERVLAHGLINLSEVEAHVFKFLSDSPIDSNLLLHQTGLSFPELAATLTMLELAGFAKRLAGDRIVGGWGQQRKNNQGLDNVNSAATG